MGLRTRLGGARSVVRGPSSHARAPSSDEHVTLEPTRRRMSIDISRLPLPSGLRPRRAPRAPSLVSVPEHCPPTSSTKSGDTSAIPPAETVQFATFVQQSAVPADVRAVSLRRRVSSPDDAAAGVPVFTRRLLGATPDVPPREARREAGAVLSDGFVMFQVPDGWYANRTGDGFRLISGACVGYIRATSTSDAGAALCDTSRVAVLDAFEVSASPVIDARGEAVVLAVEYRNYGAGRGLALLEPAPGEGACVFGLSGPPESARFLEETEQQLLGSASTCKVPVKNEAAVTTPGAEASPEISPPLTASCAVM